MTVLSWFQKSSLGSRTTTDFYRTAVGGTMQGTAEEQLTLAAETEAAGEAAIT